MKVSEAIEKLTNKRNDALSFMSDIYKKGDAGYLANEIRVTTYNIAINTLQQIDEPQGEKVEVPPMIDKFIKDHTDPIFEICAWSDHYGNDGRTCDDPELSVVLDWYGNNPTEFYEAVVNGYTVKPKRWVVRQGGSEGWYLQGFRNSLDGDIVKQFCSHEGCIKFTDKSKAEAVATLVEGSVEEI